MNYREINCTWLWEKNQIDTTNLHKPNPCAGKNVHESFQRERERENGYFEPMVYKNQGYPGFLPKGTLNHQEWKFDIVGYR